MHVFNKNREYKIMSFNVRFDNHEDPFQWSDRLVGITEIIETYSPDVIGFQEVKEAMYTSLQDQLGEKYASYGVLRSLDDGAEMSAIFVKNERLAISNSSSFWLSATPEVEHSTGWDAALPRITSMVTVLDKESDEELFVFMNTHFDHQGIEARKNSAWLLQNEINRHNDAGTAVILTGDFNTYPGDDPYKILAAEEGMCDSYSSLSDEGKQRALTFHDFEGGTIGAPIDYIFVTSPYTITSSQIITGMYADVYPSDHYPVMVEISKK